MKKKRKDELISMFPSVPSGIAADMKNGDIFGASRAANFCVFLTYGKELFVRCYHKYSRSKDVREVQRYVFAKDGFVRYGVNSKNEWRAMRFREPVFYNCPFGHNNAYTILNVEAIFNSDMRYSRVFEWGENSSACVISYLCLYCKHPNIEYLVESGYGSLIYIQTDYYGTMEKVGVSVGGNLKSNDLLKMLGLTKSEFKLLRGNENLYQKYLITREQLPKLRPEEAFEIARSSFYAYDELIRFSDVVGSSVMRMYRYLSENNISAVIYRDHIDQCQKLGYNMHDTSISFPKDFHEMHERCSQIIKHKVSEENRKAFESLMKARLVFEYEADTLILRQPTSPDEIIAEGKALHHCVGGYAERHAKGKTNIFFIRKKADPDTPFFTIEVSNNFEIVQCHGYKNDKDTPKPEEIKIFEAEYQKYLEELRHERERIKVKSA